MKDTIEIYTSYFVLSKCPECKAEKFMFYDRLPGDLQRYKTKRISSYLFAKNKLIYCPYKMECGMCRKKSDIFKAIELYTEAHPEKVREVKDDT